ncbi:MAG: hypothetical protein WB558_07470 [Terriglobales bacterium]
MVEEYERKQELRQVYFKSFGLHTPAQQAVYDKASPLLASVLVSMLSLPAGAVHVAEAALPQF